MKRYKEIFDLVYKEIGKTIIGQTEMIEHTMIGLLCNANVLLEGYPGLAKTLTVSTISNILDMKFSRIQMTADLMPSDITGTYIIEETGGARHFKFQQGPVFSNIVLADEINRATPKTQSALLEAMQEKQVTVGNNTFKLDKPFFVLATQNPIEQEGTYPLPEAQADRFLLKVKAEYPSPTDELKIAHIYSSGLSTGKPKVLLNKDKLIRLQELVKQVPIANDLKAKVIKIVTKTRKMPDIIEYGASPRASIGLIIAAKARALMKGKNNVSSEDIENLAYPVMRHRLILNFEAERKGMSTDDAIAEVIKRIK